MEASGEPENLRIEMLTGHGRHADFVGRGRWDPS